MSTGARLERAAQRTAVTRRCDVCSEVAECYAAKDMWFCGPCAVKIAAVLKAERQP